MYMCRVYWEKRVKSNKCSMNIVGGGGGVLPPTLNSMVLEGIDIGKIFKPWKYRESKNM